MEGLTSPLPFSVGSPFIYYRCARFPVSQSKSAPQPKTVAAVMVFVLKMSSDLSFEPEVVLSCLLMMKETLYSPVMAPD